MIDENRPEPPGGDDSGESKPQAREPGEAPKSEPKAPETAAGPPKPEGGEAAPPVTAKEPAPGAAKPPLPGAGKPPAKKPVPKKPPVLEITPWESGLTRQLQQQFGNQISEFSTCVGQSFLVAAPESVVPILEFLKLEVEFDYLVDVTAVDYPKREERFDLVYIVYSFARNERIRVKTRIKDGYQPESAVGVHLTANWLEREVFDMFGIKFANHPNLKRILMPDGWEGHPLRKDAGLRDMDNRWVKENLGIESGQ